MKATSLLSAIEKLGGTASLITNTYNTGRTITSLEGILNGYDIAMHTEETDFYTVRSISKRGTYDMGSDYNSGDYTFCNKLKELSWATKLSNY